MRRDGPARDRLMLLRGSVVMVLGVLVLALLFANSRGDFAGRVTVTARLGSVGDGLKPGADVKYRGVLVGTVADVDVRSDGAEVEIKLDPGHAQNIPADVQVRRVPSNIFAQPAVELSDPRGGPSGGTIDEGDVLTEDRSKASIEIQTAITRVYDLVAAVRPADLAVALDALAVAFDGTGRSMGEVFARADTYLARLSSRRPQLDRLFRRAADAVEVVRDISPSLLDAVEDALVPARTFARHQRDVRSLLTAGMDLVGTVDDYLAANGDRIVTVLRLARPVGEALGDDRQSITGSFLSLADFTEWGPRIPHGADGPVVRVDFQFMEDVLQPYTSADCPVYGPAGGVPAMAGPNCGNAVTTSRASGGTVGPVGSDSEDDAVRRVVGALEGRAGTEYGDAATLLVGPLLRGAGVVIR